MDIFDGLVPSDNISSSLNIDSMDLSGQFPSQISVPSTSCIDNQWDLLECGSSYLHGRSVGNQNLDSLFHEPSNLQSLEEFNSTDFSTYFLQGYHLDDDILQWAYPLQEEFDPALNNDLKTRVADLSVISSQSCVTNLISGKGRSSCSPSNKDTLTDDFGKHSGNDKSGELLESIITAPMVGNKNTSAMECVLEIEGSPTVVPKKGLFSELGLDELLSYRTVSRSSAKSSNEDQFSDPKRQKIDCIPAMGKHTPLSPLGSHPVENFTMKSEGILWSDKSDTADAKSCITAQTKRAEESSKVTKKRARPGESTRPRPKDRQMIQDRMKELREIIPNGAKFSIDSLLDRTIKHMLFMQGIKNYVDKLKQVDELKAQTQRDNNNGRITGSASWAIEVGGQNPIVVEDIGNSGQMLIEMQCEEQGFFLEIADVIRSFGLTILKGVLEARNEKIWAHFIIEANRDVTRMEILMSLLQFFQDTPTSDLKTR